VNNADGVPIRSLYVALFAGIRRPTASWPTWILIARHAGWRTGFRPLQPGIGRNSKKSAKIKETYLAVSTAIE
jgi:hypothetical protein